MKYNIEFKDGKSKIVNSKNESKIKSYITENYDKISSFKFLNEDQEEKNIVVIDKTHDILVANGFKKIEDHVEDRIKVYVYDGVKVYYSADSDIEISVYIVECSDPIINEKRHNIKDSEALKILNELEYEFEGVYFKNFDINKFKENIKKYKNIIKENS